MAEEVIKTQATADKKAKGEMTDMVGFARRIAQRDLAASGKGAAGDAAIPISSASVRVLSPAKANLFLGVEPRREDGYHDVLNVMHTIMMHDIVTLTRSVYAAEAGAVDGEAEARDLTISVSMFSAEDHGVPDVPEQENLAYKAVWRLAIALGLFDAVGRMTEQGRERLAEGGRNREHIAITIEKHIPSEAGMGGGSSNAAAALVGAATLWGVDLDDPAILAVAQKLGADVAFFLNGGCGAYDGAGEHLVKTYPTRKDAIVWLKPKFGCSTAQIYRLFDEVGTPVSAEQKARVLAAETAEDIPLQNDLEFPAAAYGGEIAEYLEWLRAQPEVSGAVLCGSGSSMIGICSSSDAAYKIVVEAKKRGWPARMSSFVNVRACVLPNR